MLNWFKNFFALERNVAILAFTALIWMSGEGLWLQFLPKFLQEVTSDIVLVGILESVFLGSYSVAHVIGGYLSDVYGRKKIFIIGLSIGIPALLVFITANFWLMLVPGLVLFGLSTGMSETADSLTVTESLKRNKRATGRATIHIVTAGIVMLVAPIGGLIIQNMGVIEGVRFSMLINVIIGAAATFIGYIFLKETLLRRHREKRFKIDLGAALGFLRRIPVQVKYLISCRIFSLFAWSIMFPFFVIYALNVIKVTPVEAGIVFSFHAIFFAIFTLTGAKISDRYGRKYTIIGLFASAALFPIATVLSTGFISLLLVGILGGMIGFGLSSIDAYTADHVPKKLRGKSMGLANTIYAASMAPGPVIGGVLYALSPETPFIVSGIIAAMSVVMGLKLLK